MTTDLASSQEAALRFAEERGASVFFLPTSGVGTWLWLQAHVPQRVLRFGPGAVPAGVGGSYPVPGLL